MKEKELIEKIRIWFQENRRGRLFRRNSGLLPDGRGGRMRVNYTGQADLDGFVLLRVRGVDVPIFLAIEAKTKGKKMSDGQLKTREAFSKMRVIYHVVREDHLELDLKDLDEEIEHFHRILL